MEMEVVDQNNQEIDSSKTMIPSETISSSISPSVPLPIPLPPTIIDQQNLQPTVLLSTIIKSEPSSSFPSFLPPPSAIITTPPSFSPSLPLSSSSDTQSSIVVDPSNGTMASMNASENIPSDPLSTPTINTSLPSTINSHSSDPSMAITPLSSSVSSSSMPSIDTGASMSLSNYSVPAPSPHSPPSPSSLKKYRGRWTPEEDELLREAVNRYDQKNWKKIAQSAFGDTKTDVQCLHRWQKVLRPGLVKGPWTKEEDEKVVDLVNKFGLKKWSLIATHLKGRLGKQCRERWYNHLSPTIKKDIWTPEEDLIILQSHGELGNKWALIAHRLSGRTDNAVKNRWNSTLQRLMKKQTQDGATLQTVLASVHGAATVQQLIASGALPPAIIQLPVQSIISADTSATGSSSEVLPPSPASAKKRTRTEKPVKTEKKSEKKKKSSKEKKSVKKEEKNDKDSDDKESEEEEDSGEEKEESGNENGEGTFITPKKSKNKHRHHAKTDAGKRSKTRQKGAASAPKENHSDFTSPASSASSPASGSSLTALSLAALARNSPEKTPLRPSTLTNDEGSASALGKRVRGTSSIISTPTPAPSLSARKYVSAKRSLNRQLQEENVEPNESAASSSTMKSDGLSLLSSICSTVSDKNPDSEQSATIETTAAAPSSSSLPPRSVPRSLSSTFASLSSASSAASSITTTPSNTPTIHRQSSRGRPSISFSPPSSTTSILPSLPGHLNNHRFNELTASLVSTQQIISQGRARDPLFSQAERVVNKLKSADNNNNNNNNNNSLGTENGNHQEQQPATMLVT